LSIVGPVSLLAAYPRRVDSPHGRCGSGEAGLPSIADMLVFHSERRSDMVEPAGNHRLCAQKLGALKSTQRDGQSSPRFSWAVEA